MSLKVGQCPRWPWHQVLGSPVPFSSPTAAPQSGPHRMLSCLETMGQQLPWTASPVPASPFPPTCPSQGTGGPPPPLHSCHAGSPPPWDFHSCCLREESLEQGLPCHWDLGVSLPLMPRRAMGSPWEVPVRGVIHGPQVVYDPIHKLLILAPQLSPLQQYGSSPPNSR